MDSVPNHQKNAITCDFLLAWRAIANGVTDKTNQSHKKYWRHWCSYCSAFNTDPFLRTRTELQQQIIITGFAARVRTGFYGHGHQIKVQSVTDALAAISKTIELVGQQSPIYKAHNVYKLPIERLVEGFRREDPPAIPQLALPVTVPTHCYNMAYSTSDLGLQAAADLILISFYYLLRVGEYTHPRQVQRGNHLVRATRTKQFAVKDVGFFKNGQILT